MMMSVPLPPFNPIPSELLNDAYKLGKELVLGPTDETLLRKTDKLLGEMEEFKRDRLDIENKKLDVVLASHIDDNPACILEDGSTKNDDFRHEAKQRFKIYRTHAVRYRKNVHPKIEGIRNMYKKKQIDTTRLDTVLQHKAELSDGLIALRFKDVEYAHRLLAHHEKSLSSFAIESIGLENGTLFELSNRSWEVIAPEDLIQELRACQNELRHKNRP